MTKLAGTCWSLVSAVGLVVAGLTAQGVWRPVKASEVGHSNVVLVMTDDK